LRIDSPPCASHSGDCLRGYYLKATLELAAVDIDQHRLAGKRNRINPAVAVTISELKTCACLGRDA
jgi:hypothetical protein